MRFSSILPSAVALCAAVSSIHSQTPRTTRIGPGEIFAPSGGGFLEAQPRAVIGLGTTSAATSRDTIGILVRSVDEGSPAEKAGIEEGSRIASINGVDVRGTNQRDSNDDFFNFRPTNLSRLEREMARVKPGDDVDLRVYYNNQF